MGSTATASPHVVIVGAGFGGSATAQALGGSAVQVTVIDRRNYHLFQLLLYQVATAVLSPGEIAEPIRRILSSHRARLEGTTERGPARGALRQATRDQLGATDDGLDLVGVTIGRDIAGRRARQTARRKAWTQALRDAQSAMAQNQDRSPEWVLDRFTPLLDRLKATVPHGPSRTKLPSPHARSHQPASGAEVDIALLNHMGYVQEGRVLGAQLGWSRDWLGGSKRRVSFLIDLRSRPACAVFVVQEGRKPQRSCSGCSGQSPVRPAGVPLRLPDDRRARAHSRMQTGS